MTVPAVAAAALMVLAALPTSASGPQIVADPTTLRIEHLEPGVARSAPMTLTNTSDVDVVVTALMQARGELVSTGASLSIRARSCDEPWVGQECANEATEVLLGQASTGVVSQPTDLLLAAGDVAYLLVDVELGAETGNDAAGLSAGMSLTWVGIDPVAAAAAAAQRTTTPAVTSTPAQEPVTPPELGAITSGHTDAASARPGELEAAPSRGRWAAAAGAAVAAVAAGWLLLRRRRDRDEPAAGERTGDQPHTRWLSSRDSAREETR